MTFSREPKVSSPKEHYMNRWLMALSFALLVADPTNVAAEVNAPWIKDYNQARAEAKRTGKPMLVVFR
jgi:hypothetical protein